MTQVHQQHHPVTGWTGWISMAGFLMLASGALHILYGIGGVFGQDWYMYAAGNAYLFDASVWGWSMIVGGILLAISAMLLLMGNVVGRMVGAVIAMLNIGANIALFPAAPIWSSFAIVINLFILYAIVTHGSEMKVLAEE